MANQPPAGRPWLLRLASQARMEPQIQAPPPQPALPSRGPPIRLASLALGRTPLLASDPPPSPTQPRPLPQTAPPARLTSPPPTQPRPLPQTALPAQLTSPQPVAPPTPQRPPSPRPVATAAARSPTPPQSPKVIQTPSPPPSSISRMTSTRPPSSTPLPHPEPEPKRTVEQDNAKKSGANGSSNGIVEAQKKSRSNMKAFPSPPPLEKKDIRKTKAVTIAGHNIGAFMDLGSSYGSQTRRQQVHYAKSSSQAEDVKNTEVKTYAEEKLPKVATKQQPMLSLVNSNVQSVNSSLLFNTTCAQRSPGVHINLASNGHEKPSSPH
ncbi:hypothetical protein BHE74_00007221 [Ensete ventricosum]|nr:hypothetical protein BHE74_00007221 [Ensete ventricosum]